ncbi:hypothetical protein [Acinetobacter sp. CWB-B33]|uniref:hypothetical protein n=1 Tax=Acinetobacter sp. CWB-B33 TaxID=2815724 RepID=UPI0031FE644E
MFQCFNGLNHKVIQITLLRLNPLGGFKFRRSQNDFEGGWKEPVGNIQKVQARWTAMLSINLSLKARLGIKTVSVMY